MRELLVDEPPYLLRVARVEQQRAQLGRSLRIDEIDDPIGRGRLERQLAWQLPCVVSRAD